MTSQEIINAIQSFYGDTSRTREETKEGLEEMMDEISIFLDTLRDE